MLNHHSMSVDHPSDTCHSIVPHLPTTSPSSPPPSTNPTPSVSFTQHPRPFSSQAHSGIAPAGWRGGKCAEVGLGVPSALTLQGGGTRNDLHQLGGDAGLTGPVLGKRRGGGNKGLVAIVRSTSPDEEEDANCDRAQAGQARVLQLKGGSRLDCM